MTGEVKRNAVRILSNYARLGATFVFGILLVPIMIEHLGLDGFGLWGLIGATVGIADMFREIVRTSMNRELSAAYNDPDPAVFPVIYNAAIAIALGAAGLAALVFIGIWLALPLLDIPDHLMDAARVVVLSQGVYSVLFVALAPQFNLYIATERMILSNFWQTLDRATHLASAVILFLLVGIDDPARGLTSYAILSASMAVAFLLLAVATMVVLEPRSIPKPSLISRRGIGTIIHTVGWNSVAITATNLHIRVDQLLMNVFFGLWGNGVFTVGVRLTGYVRMLAQGMTDGLDAVSARMTTANEQSTLLTLTRHSTRLHALVAFPACVAVLVLAEPMIDLWVGKRLANPETDLPFAVAAARILVIGSTARAIGDGWIRILYGAGYVRRYAPIVLLTSFLNPIIAITLIVTLPTARADRLFDEVSGPALAYAFTTVLTYFIFIPLVASRCVRQPVARFTRPLLRPAIATLAATPALLAVALAPWQWSLPKLVASIAAFGVAYAVAASILVLRPDERRHILRRIRLRPAGYTPHQSGRGGESSGAPFSRRTPK